MIGNKVLVLMRKRQETASGIAIPTQWRTVEQWGEVKSVGDKVTTIKEGDLVFVESTQGTHFAKGEDDFIILEEDKVKAKLEE